MEINFETLIDKLLNMAVERAKEEDALKYSYKSDFETGGKK